MGRIPESNKRYRTKDRMVEDIVFVLTAPLSYGAKFSVVNDVSWAWTEFDGKYKGCPLWTEGAVLQYAADPKSNRLRHEHAVPKKVVMEMLFDLGKPIQEAVRSICDKFLVGVVVMVEEDAVLNCEFSKSMPLEFFDRSSPEFHDPLLRYKRCGIRVVQRG